MQRVTKRNSNGQYYMDGDGIFSDWGTPEKFMGDDVDTIGAIEDILGDDYDLDRLRVLVEADRDGRWSENGRREPRMMSLSISEKPTRQSILDDAKRCVCGNRDQQYGSPENSFKAIASMWNSYLYARGLMENHTGKWKGIKPEDVAAMMVLFKCARIATGQNKVDNWIDAAGYAACGGEVGGNK